MKRSVLMFSLVVIVLTGSITYAHHSMAMFESEKTVTLDGTVKYFKWVSPHAFIGLTVPYKSGPIDWTVEMGGGGVTTLIRGGWSPETIKFGDKVTIVCRPMKNGTAGCNFVQMTLPDGKVMKIGGVQ